MGETTHISRTPHFHDQIGRALGALLCQDARALPAHEVNIGIKDRVPRENDIARRQVDFTNRMHFKIGLQDANQTDDELLMIAARTRGLIKIAVEQLKIGRPLGERKEFRSRHFIGDGAARLHVRNLNETRESWQGAFRRQIRLVDKITNNLLVAASFGVG